ncbi:MAG: hypothetical protein K6L76_01190 [Agarilytica sp.]
MFAKLSAQHIDDTLVQSNTTIDNNANSFGFASGANDKTTPPSSRLTHIVMPYGDQMSVLFPMLAHLSKEDNEKWFTCITPPHYSIDIFRNQDIDQRSLRIVRGEHCDDRLWMAWDALSNGKSATVVIFVDQLHESDRIQLEEAANLGKTRAVIIEAR